MNHENENENAGADWIEDLNNDLDSSYGEVEFVEIESSSLTWDEETVRDAHRSVSLRARRASGGVF